MTRTLTQHDLALRALRGQTLSAAETRALSQGDLSITHVTPLTPPWWTLPGRDQDPLLTLEQATGLLSGVSKAPAPLLPLAWLAEDQAGMGLMPQGERERLESTHLSAEHLALCGALVLGHTALERLMFGPAEGERVTRALEMWAGITRACDRSGTDDMEYVLGWLIGSRRRAEHTLSLGQGEMAETLRGTNLQPYSTDQDLRLDWRAQMVRLAWESGSRYTLTLATPLELDDDNSPAAQVHESDARSLRRALDDLWPRLNGARRGVTVTSLQALGPALLVPELPERDIHSLEGYLTLCELLILMQLTPQGLAWTGLDAPQGVLQAIGPRDGSGLTSDLQSTPGVMGLQQATEPWSDALRGALRHIRAGQGEQTERWLRAQGWISPDAPSGG